MNIKSVRSILKGLKDAIKYKSLNPFWFQVSQSKAVNDYSDFYLVCKIKHEAHLLDKATKNPYVEGRGDARKGYLSVLLKELKQRNCGYEEIIQWSDEVLEKFSKWKDEGRSQHVEGKVKFENLLPLSVPSIRFWEEGMPSKEDLLDCVKSAQLASASCNRQAFLIKVEVNNEQNFEKVGARNESMFSAAPYRVFIYINRRNYTEKYSAFIDLGMFAQNFVLQAKQMGLGCCCCYASEHIETGQDTWRKKFNLEKEYYCGLTILVGYPKELVEKPPRVDAEKITEFRGK